MTKKEIFEFVKSQREGMGASDARRDAGLEIPSDVKCFFDIRYSNADENCLLDVYRPKRAAKKILPVIASVHGGGWVYGDKKLYSFYCMELTRRGFAVVNFTYRLSPEHKFPAALEDTNNVFKWILENSSKYNLDAENTARLASTNNAIFFANI